MFGDAAEACEVVADPFDVGMIQASALRVDAPATLRAHREHLSEFDAVVERERSRLAAFAPDAVVSDCGPAPIEAAGRIGVPAFVVSNFTWDWILEEYAESDPRWRPIVERYARAYERADAYWRLPMHGGAAGPFSKVVDFPHLVREPRLDAKAALKAIGIDPAERRPIVFVSFGGFSEDRFTGDIPDDCSDFLFLGFSDPPPGWKAEWVRLPAFSPVGTVDILRACSAVIGKLGYGTVSECLVYEIPMLFVPRSGFREIGCIERAIDAAGGFRALAERDFRAGRWRRGLEELLSGPAPRKAPGDGARRLCEALVAVRDEMVQ
jgi:hypothetical protein